MLGIRGDTARLVSGLRRVAVVSDFLRVKASPAVAMFRKIGTFSKHRAMGVLMIYNKALTNDTPLRMVCVT